MEKRGLKFIILQALAHQLQIWADFVFKQVNENEYSVLQNRSSIDDTSGPGTSHVVSSPEAQIRKLQEVERNKNADTPPAHWLARVQQDVPELLVQKRHSSVRATAQLPSPLVVRTDSPIWPTETEQASGSTPAADTRRTEHNDGSGQTGDAWSGRTAQVTEIAGTKKDLSSLVEALKQQGIEAMAHRDIASSPNFATKQDIPASTSIGRVQEPLRTGNPGVQPVLLPSQEWPSPRSATHLVFSSPEERTGIRPVQQLGYDLSPQADIAKTKYQYQPSGKTDDQVQMRMHWPALPEGTLRDSQDWELVWRLRERQQRLDEEQRGSSWNA